MPVFRITRYSGIPAVIFILGAFFAAAKNRAIRFNSSTLPAVKSPVFPLLSLALPKNGIHAIFGLYVFAKQKRMRLSQPAPRRARPPE
ncbi:MAG: hypothetical protein LBG07_00915, partial [Treponema sp.]|nr:hypothetical protein [Treponema sp.]